MPWTGRTHSGRYGESGAFDAVAYLKDLRQQLDAGQISVGQFLQEGRKAAEDGYRAIGDVARQGSAAANIVNPLLSELQKYGWRRNDLGQIEPSLPREYELKLRQEILPKNISEEERAAYLAEIPEDINLLSDRGQIEREGLRQGWQLKELAKQQKSDRATNLKDLAEFLTKEEARQFDLRRPDIAEEANSGGYYTGTGYSEALAKEKAILHGNTQALLAAQGISDRDADIQALAAITGRRQDYQESGLQRQFGLGDEERNFRRTRELAELLRPEQQSSRNIGELLGLLTGGALGAYFGRSPEATTAGASIGSSAGRSYDK